MLSLFFVVFAFSACQQSIAETVVQNEIDTNSNEVAVIDGRLSFKTNEAFGQFIEQVQLTPIQERKAREDEMGYRSLYEAGNTLNDFEIHKKLHTTTYLSSTTMPIEIVEDPDFASVLNQDGIVQLGEMVFKVTRNHIFFTSVDELNRLADDDYLANLVNNNTTAGKARNGSNTQVYLNSMDNIGYANVERPILEGDEDNQGRDVGGGVVDPNDPSTWEYDNLPDTQEVGKTWRKTYSSEKKVYWRILEYKLDSLFIFRCKN